MLDQLVDERVMYAAALKAGLTVTDAELQGVIAEIPAFREDGGTGKFSPALYQSALRGQGMTERMFEAMLRKDLILSRARQSVATTAFVPASVMDRLYRLRAQEREVSQLVLSPEQFAGKVKIEPEAVKAYYDGQSGPVQLPEKVRVQYVILSLDGVQRQVQVTPEQIKKYYEERRAQFEKPEERRASHILITLPAGATPGAEGQGAREGRGSARAGEEIPAGLRRAGEEELRGPRLGHGRRRPRLLRRAARWSSRSTMRSSACKVGDIAGPVETQFGFHVIKLDAIKPAEGPKLESVKAQVEEELRKAEAGKRFAEAAETFSNLVYEQPDSLKPAVDDAQARAADQRLDQPRKEAPTIRC